MTKTIGPNRGALWWQRPDPAADFRATIEDPLWNREFQFNLKRHNQENEGRIRSLLERWVSGVEPAVCYDSQFRVIGLCDDATRPGDKPFILKCKE